MEWQSIETAPKDGEEFMAIQDGEIYHCKWIENNNGFAYRTHKLRKKDEIHTYLNVEGYEDKMPVVTNQGNYVFEHSWSLYQKDFGFCEPTEWMSLPEAPSK